MNSILLHFPFRNFIYRLREERKARSWNGTGPAPHPIKQRTVKKYAEKYGIRILVETGTYYGDMVEAMRNDFERIYSIELSAALATKAARRFRSHSNITILQGDSATVLGEIVPTLTAPALFWLDGHYSGGVTARGESDTPIYKELGHVLASSLRHVVLIDDARCFGSDPAYPSIDDLSTFTRKQLKIENDALILEP
jgi:hypothetical protein